MQVLNLGDWPFGIERQISWKSENSLLGVVFTDVCMQAFWADSLLAMRSFGEPIDSVLGVSLGWIKVHTSIDILQTSNLLPKIQSSLCHTGFQVITKIIPLRYNPLFDDSSTNEFSTMSVIVRGKKSKWVLGYDVSWWYQPEFRAGTPILWSCVSSVCFIFCSMRGAMNFGDSNRTQSRVKRKIFPTFFKRLKVLNS